MHKLKIWILMCLAVCFFSSETYHDGIIEESGEILLVVATVNQNAAHCCEQCRRAINLGLWCGLVRENVLGPVRFDGYV